MRNAVRQCQWIVFLKSQNNSRILFRRGLGLVFCPSEAQRYALGQCAQLERLFADNPTNCRLVNCGHGDCGIVNGRYCAWGNQMTSPNVSFES